MSKHGAFVLNLEQKPNKFPDDCQRIFEQSGFIFLIGKIQTKVLKPPKKYAKSEGLAWRKNQKIADKK